jgi:hypothetical protein
VAKEMMKRKKSQKKRRERRKWFTQNLVQQVAGSVKTDYEKDSRKKEAKLRLEANPNFVKNVGP